MRAEDQLKAEDEEEVQEIVQDLTEGRDDEQAEEQAVEDMPAAARHFQSIVTTMHAVLDNREVNLASIAELSMMERQALEVLQQVVTARDRRNGFMFAEERLQQLNQVLAVLQPALSLGNAPGLAEVNAELYLVIDEVEDLRERLNDRDAAEEEMEPAHEARAAEGDKDDDDDEDEDETDNLGEVPEPGAPPRPSILSAGPAAPERASPPTTLTGTPAAPDRPVAPTTLIGSPEAPDFTPPPSTLFDDAGTPAAPEPAPTGGAPAPAAPTRPARGRRGQ